MPDYDDGGVFDDLPEPGIFSGILTLLGGLAGSFLVTYTYLYGASGGPLAGFHIAAVIGFGVIFSFLLAAFTFLIGWIIELVWPLLGSLIFVSVLLTVPLLYYFGIDVLTGAARQAFMFGY